MQACQRLTAVSLVIGILLTWGCASPHPTGICYTDVTLPVAAAGGPLKCSKVGVARCHTLFGLVARGDASIDTAAKNGGIKSVSHVDFTARSILGIAGVYTTTVYGE